MVAATQSLSFEAQSLSLSGHLNGSEQGPQELISGVGNSWSYGSLSILLSNLGTLARVYVYTLLLMLLFALTYITTSLHFKATRWSKSKGKTVPLVPYSIPVIGHAMAFAYSVAGLIQDNIHLCADGFGNYSPIRFRGLNVEISFISGPKDILAMFKQSRKFSAKASVAIGIYRIFGTPKQLLPSLYENDDTGSDALPFPGARDVAPHLRIHHIVHVHSVKYMSGNRVKPMTDRLMELITKSMLNSGIGGVWLEVDDLFEFYKVRLLHASLNCMFGEYLTALHPSFVDDYWKFDECTPTLVKGLPSFMVPRSWAARRKCLESLKHWKAYVEKLADADDRTVYHGHDPHFGSELIRQRHEAFNKMEPMNADSIASEDLAMMWATNSNSIPAAWWLLYEVCKDPELLLRVRSEVSRARSDAHEPDASPRFDLGILVESPLLQSLYAETLRLQTANLIVRMPAKDDFHLSDYSFKKDKLIMVASYVAHHDTDVWNQGTVEDHHPLNKFWAERFLIKTGPPHSGPLSPSFSGRRMDASATTRPAPPIRVDSMMQNLPKEPGVKFSLDGLTGSWLPYGGGQSLCPGRHFAKQEMLMSLAIMTTCFDIEILEEQGEANLPDLRYFGLGVQPPKNKTRFRIRRRNFNDDWIFE